MSGMAVEEHLFFVFAEPGAQVSAIRSSDARSAVHPQISPRRITGRRRLAGLFQKGIISYFHFQADGAMVRARDIAGDPGVCNVGGQICGNKKIIQTPAGVSFAAKISV